IAVVLHAGIGILTSVYLVIFFFRIMRGASIQGRIGWLLIAISAVLGLVLVKTGTSRPEWKLVYLHIAGAVAGSAILFAEWAGRKGWLAPGFAKAAFRYAVCLIALAGLSTAAWYSRNSRWLNHARIENPADPPASMNDEGDG